MLVKAPHERAVEQFINSTTLLLEAPIKLELIQESEHY